MAEQAGEAHAPAFRSVYTPDLPRILGDAGISLAVSTYQSNRLILVRQSNPRQPGDLNTRLCAFDKPMGVCARDRHLAVGTRHSICTYLDVPVVLERLAGNEVHDSCYVPRSVTFTGNVDIHEMDWDGNGQLWFVNTRFSCLCTAMADASFMPRWRPPFVSSLAPEDRCHLNGLGMRDGKPRYVTALGASDEPNGWRPEKASGGVLLDVTRDTALAEGLSMPHSPRWYRDGLWFLESGKGALCRLADDGSVHSIATLPGFVRGLDFAGSIAFVGLSMVRETATFSGLPLNRDVAQRTCGVWAVHIDSGEVLGFLRFEGHIEEIFSVTVLTHRLGPELLAADSPHLENVYVLPDDVFGEVSLTDRRTADQTPDAAYRRGRQMLAEGRAAAAVEKLRTCLGLEDSFPHARLTLGVALAQAGWLQDALTELTAAAEQEPDRADVHASLGTVYQRLDEPGKAREAYEEAIRRDPRDAVAHANLGHLLLRLGDYQRGFAEYAWRLPDLPATRRRWNGESAGGATLLVRVGGHDLNGTLVLMRLVPLAAARVASVVVTGPDSWLPLLAAVAGVSTVRSAADLPSADYDLEVLLDHLPRVLGLKSADRIPPPPYLDPGSVGPAGSRHGSSATIGVALEPAPNDRFRELISTLKVDGLSLVALTPASAELLHCQGLQHDPPPPSGDLAALAGTICTLDGVVGHDGTAVCLAGAMGKPAWLVPGRTTLAWWWPWGHRRSDWFPTARVLDPADLTGLRAGAQKLLGR